MHDPRIGRFLSVDPLAPEYPWNSSYAFSENRVIDGVELEGLERVRYYEIPGEIGKAVSWGGERVYNLGVQTVEGLAGLLTDPAGTAEQVWEGTKQTASDVGVIFGYFGRNVYSTISSGEGAKLNEEEFYGAVERQGNAIVDGALGGGGALAVGKVINKLPSPDPLPHGTVTSGFGGGRKRLPRSDGDWSGVRGESTWYSDKPEVNAITGGQGVEFSGGYPDFSPWSAASFEIEGLVGNYNSDFSKVHKKMVEKWGFPTQTAAEDWLKKNGYTPHHHQDGVTIQLVPTDLHSNTPHTGGAANLRNEQ